MFFFFLACTRPVALPTPATPNEAPVATPAASASASAGPVVLNGAQGPISVTPVYHGTVLVETQGLRIWVDPWQKAPLSGAAADLVLITDIHPDHLDADALQKVLGPATVLVAPPAVAEQYKARPIDHVLKNGEKATIKDIEIEAVPMYNLVRGPKEGQLFHDKGRGNGYILTIGGQRIYLSGDTECTPEMKALQNIDLAFISMNLPYTMTPTEAAECVAAFKPKQVTPYHYAGSDLSQFHAALASVSGVTITERDAYPGGLPW